MLSTFCLQHNIIFPIRNAIDAGKIEFHHSITSYQLKSEVDIKELMNETVGSIVKLLFS